MQVSHPEAVFGAEAGGKPSANSPELIAEPVVATLGAAEVHAVDVVSHCDGHAADRSNEIEETEASPRAAQRKKGDLTGGQHRRQ